MPPVLLEHCDLWKLCRLKALRGPPSSMLYAEAASASASANHAPHPVDSEDQARFDCMTDSALEYALDRMRSLDVGSHAASSLDSCSRPIRTCGFISQQSVAPLTTHVQAAALIT